MDIPENQPSKTAPLIELQSVCKSYSQAGKEIIALQDVSLTIHQGDIYGFIGLSGAGKSTLIRALARLVTPTSGQILFCGNPLASMSKENLRIFRKKTGMVFQHFNLLASRDVYGNIAYPMEVAGVPRQARDAKILELLDLVGLKEKKHAYPSQLSGGEKQRVGIARALANDPDVLFCDEATSALDPRTTKEILRLLQRINKKLGLTIILITHEMRVIKEICNQVAVLEHGKIVEQGAVVDVFSEPRHPTTKHFLEESLHEIPDEFFKKTSPNRKLLRLRFKGTAAKEPLISGIVRTCNVDANILMGWIDRLQSLFLGTLIIELTGSPEGIAKALEYLRERKVGCEVIDNER